MNGLFQKVFYCFFINVLVDATESRAWDSRRPLSSSSISEGGEEAETGLVLSRPGCISAGQPEP